MTVILVIVIYHRCSTVTDTHVYNQNFEIQRSVLYINTGLVQKQQFSVQTVWSPCGVHVESVWSLHRPRGISIIMQGYYMWSCGLVVISYDCCTLSAKSWVQTLHIVIYIYLLL